MVLEPFFQNATIDFIVAILCLVQFFQQRFQFCSWGHFDSFFHEIYTNCFRFRYIVFIQLSYCSFHIERDYFHSVWIIFMCVICVGSKQSNIIASGVEKQVNSCCTLLAAKFHVFATIIYAQSCIGLVIIVVFQFSSIKN